MNWFMIIVTKESSGNNVNSDQNFSSYTTNAESRWLGCNRFIL